MRYIKSIDKSKASEESNAIIEKITCQLAMRTKMLQELSTVTGQDCELVATTISDTQDGATYIHSSLAASCNFLTEQKIRESIGPQSHLFNSAHIQLIPTVFAYARKWSYACFLRKGSDEIKGWFQTTLEDNKPILAPMSWATNAISFVLHRVDGEKLRVFIWNRGLGKSELASTLYILSLIHI